MPETDLDGVKRALGTICLDVDGSQQHETPKLKSVEPGSVEAYYMLAAFCFDLARKLDYVFKATKAFAEYADRGLASEVKDDYDYLYDRRVKTWKERAERAEEVLLRLYNEIAKDHEALLKRAAGRR
jgi:hypothetical protein